MRFRSHKPSRPLSDFVDNFWLCEGYTSPHLHILVENQCQLQLLLEKAKNGVGFASGRMTKRAGEADFRQRVVVEGAHHTQDRILLDDLKGYGGVIQIDLAMFDGIHQRGLECLCVDFQPEIVLHLFGLLNG